MYLDLLANIIRFVSATVDRTVEEVAREEEAPFQLLFNCFFLTAIVMSEMVL
jgi:hypothetical protein